MEFNRDAHLFPFSTGNTIFVQIGPKNQNCQFKLNFWYPNSKMQKSMVAFALSVFAWKKPSWANLVQKFKIVSLSWNLTSRLFQTCKIQWWCSLFLLQTFFASLVQKMQLAFWWYPINLPAVYLQKLEGSGFSCFN